MTDLSADDLREVERRRLAALVAADIELARSLHAEDYELITPGGGQLGREAYLEGVGSGDLHYLVFEPATEIRVRLDGPMAVLRYQARIEIEYSGDIDSDLFWHTDVYELRDGRWQAVWSQATRIKAR